MALMAFLLGKDVFAFLPIGFVKTFVKTQAQRVSYGDTRLTSPLAPMGSAEI